MGGDVWCQHTMYCLPPAILCTKIHDLVNKALPSKHSCLHSVLFKLCARRRLDL